MHDHDDFDFEHSPGIPAPLPEGEQILWQGSPDFSEVAVNAFHIRKIAVYFAMILLIQAFSIFKSGTETLSASLSLTVLLSTIGLGILLLLAYLTSRVTIYTVTNKRVLIRFGIALQMTINLPFSQIRSADMRVGKNGFGDIPLQLKDNGRVSYIVLWPNVRPWKFARPEPMLRSIPNVQDVAQLVAQAAIGHSGEETFKSSQIPVVRKRSAREANQNSSRHAHADGFTMKPEIS